MFLSIPDTVPESSHLLTVRDLLHIAQVNGFFIYHYGFSAHCLHLDPVISLKCGRWFRTPSEIRLLRRSIRSGNHRVILRFLLGIVRDILRDITVHLDNRIRDMEISTRTSCHDHCGDSIIIVQLPDPLDKWRDGLHIPVNHPLHQLIPDHEVRCARIFINQHKGRARLNALNYICGLRCASACVLRAESHGVFSVGKIVNKHGNIRLLDAPSILCPDLHRRVIRNHILSAVPGDVIINAQLQGFEKSRFSMISSANNQGDPFPDSHSLDGSFMRQLQSYLKLCRRLEAHTAFHRSRRDPGFPGQNTAVGNKCAQPHFRKPLADIVLILREVNDPVQPLRVHILIEESLFHTLRHEVEEDLLQLPRIDRPSIRRESDLHAHHHIPALRINPACRSLKHLLGAPAHRDQPALSRTFCLEGELIRTPPELPRQFILKRDPLVVFPVQFRRESGVSAAHVHAHL